MMLEFRTVTLEVVCVLEASHKLLRVKLVDGITSIVDCLRSTHNVEKLFVACRIARNRLVLG